MQLSVHEDDPKSKSKVDLRFHFLFDMIRKTTRNYLKDFDWDVCSQPVQRLYLSKDTKLMMEVINDFIATVYYRVNLDDNGRKSTNRNGLFEDVDFSEDCGQPVKWIEKYKIKRYPKSLVDKTSVPYLFSPNFTYMIDFNYRAK